MIEIEIIAEIGVNHNGDLDTACRLVDLAVGAGCDAVKTQLWNTERVYPRERWDEMKKLELSRADIVTLKSFCDQRDIELIVTPDETEDAVFLKQIGVKRIKTSSQDITNVAFLKQVAALGLPMIVSTGACDKLELDTGVIAVMRELTSQRMTILHCVSAYPAPLDQMNLGVIDYLRRSFQCAIGLSDHTTGQQAALVALGLGARVFEKHLTLNRNQPGPDHAASMDGRDMYFYVSALRNSYAALGDGIKRVMPCEIENRRRYDAFIAPRKDAG